MQGRDANLASLLAFYLGVMLGLYKGILGLYRVYIGGYSRDYIGIGFLGFRVLGLGVIFGVILGVLLGVMLEIIGCVYIYIYMGVYIGIMKKKMETTIMVLLGLY